ncbi:Lipoprotein releasing system transmembrane protein LolC [Pseudoalteromonas luteoviolacea B = ATCC 29581]|nr:Lipoprotein releasing system transmembrane protein LolC [Pseudoalteromonas luteoviolacea B = ATCC 29581]
MIQPVSLFVGLRYSRSTKGNAFISFISFFSIAGITLGLAALIIVNSVMNGFEKNLKTSMLALIPHIKVSGEQSSLAPLLTLLSHEDKVKEYGLHTDAEAIIQTNHELIGVSLHGSDENNTILERFFVQGHWQTIHDEPFSLAISRYTAQTLGLVLGDEIRVVIPSVSNYTPMGRVPMQRVFIVRGIFATDSEADTYLAYTNYSSLAKLQKQKPDDPVSYRISLHDAFDFHSVVEQIAQYEGVEVEDWRVKQGALFSAVAMEKRIMTLLLALIVLVAAFNILSALSMMVNEKKSEVAILQTLGFTPLKIMQIFMVQGAYNGMLGTLFGVILGITLTLNINEVLASVGLNFLGATKLPVVLESTSIAVMVSFSLLLSFIATAFPARKAASVLPAEILRYE